MLSIYDIAGIRVDMSPRFLRLQKQSMAYRVAESGEANFSISIAPQKWEEAKKAYPYLSEEDLEYMLFGTYFYRKALSYNAFLLHASAISYKGHAYVFSAPSGTGKSTHTALWQQSFSDVSYINDDKPLIVKKEDGFFCAGTPFSGKTDKNTNLTVPLRAICALRRGKETKVQRLYGAMAYYYVLDQTIRSVRKSDALLGMVEELVGTVPFYMVETNIKPDAAKIVFEHIK